MDFAGKLREFSRALGLSDAEVARRLGISTQRYGHYITGRNQPDLEMLIRICRILATSPNILLGVEASDDSLDEEEAVLRRITAAAYALSPQDRQRLMVMIEALANNPTTRP